MLEIEIDKRISWDEVKQYKNYFNLYISVIKKMLLLKYLKFCFNIYFFLSYLNILYYNLNYILKTQTKIIIVKMEN
jgi:hypothetical protein